MRNLIFTAVLFSAFSAAAANPHVLLETSMGQIEVELFEDKAPISVANFLKYVDDGFYDGTIFHRVIANFMIQGGGFDAKINKKTTRAPIKNEAHNRVSNQRYTLAMARTGIVDSATAQFFINVKDNSRLDFRSEKPRDYGYAVFGRVVSGQKVVDQIRDVKTGACLPNFRTDCPQTAVVIKRASRVGKAAPAKRPASRPSP